VEASRNHLSDGDAESPRAEVHERLKDFTNHGSGHGRLY
jgi:hypothetical protein